MQPVTNVLHNPELEDVSSKSIDELITKSSLGTLSDNTLSALNILFQNNYLVDEDELINSWKEIVRSDQISKMYIMGHRNAGTIELANSLNSMASQSAGSYITDLQAILTEFNIELPNAESSALKLSQQEIIELSKTTTLAFLRKCQGGLRAIGSADSRYREGIIFMLPENLESLKLFTYYEFVILATLILNDVVTCPVKFVIPKRK